MAAMGPSHVDRPFGCGILLLQDRGTVGIPELLEQRVSQSTSGLVVRVPHAQDVDLQDSEDEVPSAEVQVDVWVDQDSRDACAFSGVTGVPPGVLSHVCGQDVARHLGDAHEVLTEGPDDQADSPRDQHNNSFSRVWYEQDRELVKELSRNDAIRYAQLEKIGSHLYNVAYFTRVAP
jgi:hypothetical protein